MVDNDSAWTSSPTMSGWSGPVVDWGSSEPVTLKKEKKAAAPAKPKAEPSISEEEADKIIAKNEQAIMAGKKKQAPLRKELLGVDTERKENRAQMDPLRSTLDTLAAQINVIQEKKNTLFPGMAENQAMSKDLRSKQKEIGFRSLDELNRAIFEADQQLNHDSMTLREEKELIAELKRLNSLVPKLEALEAKRTKVEGDKDVATAAMKDMKSINAALNPLRDERSAVSKQLAELREIDQGFMAKRDEIRAKLDDMSKSFDANFEAIRKIRPDYPSKVNEFFNRIKAFESELAGGKKAPVADKPKPAPVKAAAPASPAKAPKSPKSPKPKKAAPEEEDKELAKKERKAEKEAEKRAKEAKKLLDEMEKEKNKVKQSNYEKYLEAEKRKAAYEEKKARKAEKARLAAEKAAQEAAKASSKSKKKSEDTRVVQKQKEDLPKDQKILLAKLEAQKEKERADAKLKDLMRKKNDSLPINQYVGIGAVVIGALFFIYLLATQPSKVAAVVEEEEL